MVAYLYLYFSCVNPMINDIDIIMRIEPEISIEIANDDYTNWLYPEYQTIDLDEYKFSIGGKSYRLNSAKQNLTIYSKFGDNKTTCSEIEPGDLPESLKW